MKKLLKELRQLKIANQLMKKTFLTNRERQYLVAMAHRQGFVGITINDIKQAA